MNKVIVKFDSRQTGNGDNTVRTKALGNHYVRNGVRYIIYKESILKDAACETCAMLKLTKDSLTLTRNGAVRQRQVFAEGKTSEGDYITPYGKFRMSVKTRRFELIGDALSFTARIDYALYLNGSWQSDNELTISVSPAG